MRCIQCSLFVIFKSVLFIQCFYAVCWVTGSAFDLQKTAVETRNVLPGGSSLTWMNLRKVGRRPKIVELVVDIALFYGFFVGFAGL